MGRGRVLAGLTTVAVFALAARAGTSVADGVGVSAEVGLGPLGAVGVSVGAGMGGVNSATARMDAFISTEETVQGLSWTLVRLLASDDASQQAIEDIANSIDTLSRVKAVLLMGA